MKRRTPDHPKVVDLEQRLRVPRYAAVGLLELLWHYTAEFSPQGNVGKYPDAAIARACHWTKDATQFVTALTETGWLDVDQEHRLLVHDWADHVDETTKKRLLRARQEVIIRRTTAAERQPNGGQRQPEFPSEADIGKPDRVLSGKAGLGTGPGTGSEDSKKETSLQKIRDPVSPPSDLFGTFWKLFRAAGKALNEADERAALTIWNLYETVDHQLIIAWVIKQMKTVWRDEQHTPMPASALKQQGWTRVSSPRIIPDPIPQNPPTKTEQAFEILRQQGVTFPR